MAGFFIAFGRKGKIIPALLIPILILFSCSRGETETPLSFPETALRLLAESAVESCSICARQMRERAYDLLDREFPPEKVLAASASCLLRRSPSTEENELMLSCDPAGKDPLPLLIFRFHTPGRHLVGISPDDFTAAGPETEYLAAAPGAAFEGVLKIIPFRFGNRPSFIHSPSRGVIQVHCQLMGLRQE
jgi:hypothetical protein